MTPHWRIDYVAGGGTSTIMSFSLASMVEVESGLCCPSVEAGLNRDVTGEVGGEMTITSGSVDTAGLEDRTSLSGLDGSKGRKSASRFERITKILSAEEHSWVVSAMEFGRSCIMDFDRTVSHLAKNKKLAICSQNVNIRFRETYSIPGTKQVGIKSVKNLGLKHED